MKNLSLFIVLFLSLAEFAAGQFEPAGKYSVTIYNTPGNSYKSNLDIISDKRGIMYFANEDGNIYEYDGYFWRIIPVSKYRLDHLGISENGRIYVGGIDDLGYLEPDLTGYLLFSSLKNKIDTTKFRVDAGLYIENILIRKNIVVFQTGTRYQPGSKRFLIYNQDSDSLISVNPAEQGFNNISGSYLVNNQFYIDDRIKGLLILSDDGILKITKVPLNFERNSIKNILPYSANELFIVYWLKGIINWCIFNTESGKTRAFVNDEQEKILHELGAFRHGTFGNDHYLIMTRRNEALIVDKKGHLVSQLDLGAPNNLFLNESDPFQYPIWGVKGKDILKIGLNSPLTEFSEFTDYAITGIIRFNSDIYIATRGGMYRMFKDSSRQIKFEKIQGIGTIQSLLQFSSENYGHNVLLAAILNQIIEIDQYGNVKPINISYQGNRVLYTGGFFSEKELIRSRFSKDLVYATDFSTLYKLRYSGKWEVVGNIKTLGRMVEADSNVIIVPGMGSELVKYTVNFKDTSVMKINLGIHFDYQNASSEEIPRFFFINDEYFYSTRLGIFKFDIKKDTVVPSTTFSPKIINDSVWIKTFDKDYNGNYWISGADKNSKPFLKIVKFKNGKETMNDTLFSHLPSTLTNIVYPEETGIVWFNKGNILYRYDEKVKKNFTIPYYALIREVIIGRDSSIFKGTFFRKDKMDHLNTSFEQPEELKPKIKYRLNTITLKWSSPFFEYENETRYRIWLDGFENEWSNWKEGHEVTYTNLRRGKYIFNVQAKNTYGILSETGIFEFTIISPWYTTIYAYLGYAILFILLLYLLVRMNNIRLRKENLRLENLVKQRTKEIEEKNRKIVESINYSKHIQDSILLKKDDIDLIIPDTFVYLRPRDIVSGDFYWFAGKEDIAVIAAIDCTGHGVPGAFMSMIGNTLMNFIVKELGITKPEEILNNLNKEIIKALQQERVDTMAQDGMDMAVCTIDKKNGIVQYSGAKNPIIVISNNELRFFEADPFSIGGNIFSRKKSKQVYFKCQEFDIVPGTSVFLFTDGFIDQPGGSENKSYGIAQFEELLRSISNLQPSQQLATLEDNMTKWISNSRQIDDILVIGIKL